MNLFKIHSSKGVREIPFPDCWEPHDKKVTPCTTRQFIQIATEWDGQDLIKLFSILSGMEYKVISTTFDPVLEAQLIESCRFVYETPMKFKEAKLPHWIEIGGKQIRIPAHVGGLSIGQNIHVRQAIDKAAIVDKETGEITVNADGLIGFVTAIYLQPLVDGIDFDYHCAMELEQKVLDLPIYKTYPLGIFFLNKLMKPGTSFTKRLSLLIQRLLEASTQREPR